MPESPLISMIGPDLDAMGGISSVARTWLGADAIKDLDVQYFGTMRDTRTKAEKAALVVRRQARFVARLATGWRPDLFHIHASYFSSFYRKMAYFKQASATGRPVIIHLHAPDLPSFYESSRLHRSAIHHIFKKAARVVVLSEDMGDMIRGWMGDDARVHRLYNPVLLDRFECPPRPERENPVMLFMGAIGERKGTWDLIQAAAEVVKTLPHARFRFGGNGEVDRLREEVTRLGLKDHVEILGWVSGEDKLKQFREADVLCLPSYHEGLPMSILEAMGAGLPVVSTTIAGIPEAVVHPTSGLLVEPGDIPALTQALIRLLGDASVRQQMGTAGRLRAEQVFDAEVIVKQVRQLWTDVLAEQGER
jgi:glycosyltransferase involved in cell wall biosynthesis